MYGKVALPFRYMLWLTYIFLEMLRLKQAGDIFRVRDFQDFTPFNIGPTLPTIIYLGPTPKTPLKNF